MNKKGGGGDNILLKQSNNLKIKNKFVKMEKIEICKKNLKKNLLTLKNKKTFMKPQKKCNLKMIFCVNREREQGSTSYHKSFKVRFKVFKILQLFTDYFIL